ncbi:Beta-xylosidase, GH43 family [Roseateles sp. YR242]|uniref:glycoside hydrolase family 43 protein n=1 Tax=Roseateles sp. YR242 TaxID=1855305 RepID=UPI0008B151C1|nr:family 43 glycosylhydrolase [Roseateles sp. YR242]SEL36825.1 Beta-xylosidase, GH43 family [Roseateles sp. YR242]
MNWTNPLIPQRADPQISQHGGRYWFTGSLPGFDAIELRSATSIAGLAAAAPHIIWRRHPQGPASWHIWAPELHRVEGRWIVYFAAGERDDIWKIRIHVLENTHADPVQGEWVERGQLKTPLDDFALDATTFEHRGTHYLSWAEADTSRAGKTNIYLAPLVNPWTLGGAPTLISEATHDWERIGFAVNEGPAVLRRHGRIFISYSAAATDHHYCMGLLWADEGADLLDAASWRKSPTPVFASANGQFGPGHNSFTTAPDGTDLLVYHARNYRDIVGDPLHDPNRHARVQPFGWNAEGFPVFGEPQPDGPVQGSQP